MGDATVNSSELDTSSAIVTTTAVTTTANTIAELAARAAEASKSIAVASTAVKNNVLHDAADLLVARADEICAANAVDVDKAISEGTESGLIDRLRLSTERIEAIAGGLRQVADLRDPVGEITDGWVRPNGLRIERVRVPLGVVAIIYESRPNVTSDAAGLCLKSGNAAFFAWFLIGHIL